MGCEDCKALAGFIAGFKKEYHQDMRIADKVLSDLMDSETRILERLKRLENKGADSE